MKKSLILLLILFIANSISAQKKGARKITGTKVTKVETTTQGKTELMNSYTSTEEGRCRVVWNNYKVLLKHILNKDENETLDISSLMPITRVKYNQNSSPALYFRKVANTEAFPVLGNHFVQQPNGVYPVAVEMVSYLHQSNGSNSVLAFTYEEGNYNNVQEVLSVYKSGNQTFIKLRRSNGAVEDIRYYPNHIIDGFEIETN